MSTRNTEYQDTSLQTVPLLLWKKIVVALTGAAAGVPLVEAGAANFTAAQRLILLAPPTNDVTSDHSKDVTFGTTVACDCGYLAPGATIDLSPPHGRRINLQDIYVKAPGADDETVVALYL